MKKYIQIYLVCFLSSAFVMSIALIPMLLEGFYNWSVTLGFTVPWIVSISAMLVYVYSDYNMFMKMSLSDKYTGKKELYLSYLPFRGYCFIFNGRHSKFLKTQKDVEIYLKNKEE